MERESGTLTPTPARRIGTSPGHPRSEGRPYTAAVRDQFLLDPDLVFLNHGSFGACPVPVFEAHVALQRELERNPVEFLGRRSAGLLRAAREALGQHLGAQADDLVFVPNATTAVNTVARSLQLQPGDEVLATDHEYGACDATWQRVCAEHGAVYRRAMVPLPFDGASASSSRCWPRPDRARGWSSSATSRPPRR